MGAGLEEEEEGSAPMGLAPHPLLFGSHLWWGGTLLRHTSPRIPPSQAFSWVNVTWGPTSAELALPSPSPSPSSASTGPTPHPHAQSTHSPSGSILGCTWGKWSCSVVSSHNKRAEWSSLFSATPQPYEADDGILRHLPSGRRMTDGCCGLTGNCAPTDQPVVVMGWP